MSQERVLTPLCKSAAPLSALPKAVCCGPMAAHAEGEWLGSDVGVLALYKESSADAVTWAGSHARVRSLCSCKANVFLAHANTSVEHHPVFQACPPANVKPLGGGGVRLAASGSTSLKR